MISADVRHIGHPAVVLACLSIASGSTDVLTFMKLGEVFTSAMTGNTALLGIAIGHGKMLAASRSLTALFGFLAGAALAAAICDLVKEETQGDRAVRRLLVLEIVCLGTCTVLWSANGRTIEPHSLYAIILLSAFSMGIQGIAGRRISSSGISTIVFTSPLIRIMTALTGTLMHLVGGAESRIGTKGHLATYAAYACAAVLTGALVPHDIGVLIWIPVMMVLLAFGLSMLPKKTDPAAA